MDVFSYDIHSHPINTLEEDLFQDYFAEFCSLHNIRVAMPGRSGFEKVARKAITDVKKKDYLRKVSVSEAEFKQMWKVECRKKEEKVRAMKNGSWKTQLYRVSFNGDGVENNKQKQPVSIRKGRFLITIHSNTNTDNDYMNNPVPVRKGRFLVTKYLVNKKKQQDKPTVTKKGRFLITTY